MSGRVGSTSAGESASPGDPAAPVDPVGVCLASGWSASGVAAGIKPDGALDLCVVASDRPATAAAVFTRNLAKAAPVLVSQEHMVDPGARAVVVSSGNANAATGTPGLGTVRAMCDAVAHEVGCVADDVLVAQTGLIGRPLDTSIAVDGVRAACGDLARANGLRAALAIMTTDTVPKLAHADCTIGGTAARVGGMVKGAGMIAPEMATMIAVLTTDAVAAPAVLDTALRDAVRESFDMIAIEGDMSTNDTVFLLANGASGAEALTSPDDPDYGGFSEAVAAVCGDLARQIVRDAEGATKFLHMQVRGAASEADARLAARAVTNSVLVKCSLAAEDAYWGRVLSSMGASGARFTPEDVRISFGGVTVCDGGVAAPHDEARVARHMAGTDIEVVAEIGSGAHAADAWGCDLTLEFVALNLEHT